MVIINDSDNRISQTQIGCGDNLIFINGERIEPPTKKGGHSISVVNNRIYVDGYERKNGKWKRILAALWHLWF